LPPNQSKYQCSFSAKLAIKIVVFANALVTSLPAHYEQRLRLIDLLKSFGELLKKDDIKDAVWTQRLLNKAVVLTIKLPF
jgi:hypothetical protein